MQDCRGECCGLGGRVEERHAVEGDGSGFAGCENHRFGGVDLDNVCAIHSRRVLCCKRCLNFYFRLCCSGLQPVTCLIPKPGCTVAHWDEV